MTPWRQFFLIKLPSAILVIGVLAEALSAGLASLPRYRHRVDELAETVTTDRQNYPVVLFGDSVTSKISSVYRIGKAGEVADLSTHADAGLASELLLLKRYLAAGHRPTHLLIATSPGFIQYPGPPGEFDQYLYSVFSKPEERQFLETEFPAEIPHWKPAAAQFADRFIPQILSLIWGATGRLSAPVLTPVQAPVLEHDLPPNVQDLAFAEQAARDSVIAPPQLDVLGQICRLSRTYQFKLDVVWAPIEPELLAIWRANGYFKAIKDGLRRAWAPDCAEYSSYDINDFTSFPYFDMGNIHIRGEGWKQLYAVQLTRRIEDLLTVAEPPPASDDQTAPEKTQ